MDVALTKNKPDTLGLVGDGDDLDLIGAIEESFGVRFTHEPSEWRTVGDMQDALITRIEPESMAGLCATSMAFYKVRDALTRVAKIQERITPITRLSDLTSISPKRLFARLSEELGISKLPIMLSTIGTLSLAMMLAGAIGGVFALVFHPAWPVMLLLPTGWALLHNDPGSYHAMSVGNVSRAVATRNFDHFVKRGADSRPAAVWRTLCAVIEGETGRAAASIRPDTRLLA